MTVHNSTSLLDIESIEIKEFVGKVAIEFNMASPHGRLGGSQTLVMDESDLPVLVGAIEKYVSRETSEVPDGTEV